MLVTALPADILRACLSTCEANDVLAAAQVCRALSAEASSDSIWIRLYEKRWPPWTLLIADDRPSHRHRELYRQRVLGKLPLTISPAVLALHGTATDSYDNNVTPLEVALCKAPATRVSAVLEITGKLLAQVHFGAGSLHNEPSSDRVWFGKVASPEGHLPVRVLLREHSSTLGHWVYEGTVSECGRRLEGTFHLSVLPRKRGIFSLTACDPATHVGDRHGGLPSPAQLVKRVAVKWCSSALRKAAARQELGLV